MTPYASPVSGWPAAGSTAVRPSTPAQVACVEPDPAIAALLGEVLAGEGWTATHVDEPAAADLDAWVARLRDRQPDLLLYALDLPDASAIARLQSLHRLLAGLPLVVTTTDPRTVTAEIGDVDGVTILAKPFDLDDLCGAVGRALTAGGR
jgi:CheY-like chemotaxis protein